MEGDSVYFRRRAEAERDAASKAANDTARNIHLEMAERYDELASAIASREGYAASGTVAA